MFFIHVRTDHLTRLPFFPNKSKSTHFARSINTNYNSFHVHSLIRALLNHFLVSIMAKHATGKISIF